VIGCTDSKDDGMYRQQTRLAEIGCTDSEKDMAGQTAKRIVCKDNKKHGLYIQQTR
jgi:hypothetical protein